MRIALVMPPRWDPVMPPLGITALKSYLQAHGHRVDCKDLNMDPGVLAVTAPFTGHVREARLFGAYEAGLTVLSRGETPEEGWAATMAFEPELRGEGRDPEVERLALAAVVALERRLGVLAEELAQELALCGYQAVGVSAFDATLDAGLWLLRRLKRLRPELTTVIGGPAASAEAQTLARFDFIDFIVAGHGEVPLRGLMDAAFKGSGKILRATREQVRRQGIRSYPLLDYSDYDLSPYGLHSRQGLPTPPGKVLGLTFGAGCSHACRFCDWKAHFGFSDMGTAGAAYRQMEHLHASHGVHCFHVCSAEINPLALEVARRVAAEGAPFRWYGPASVDPALFSVDNAAWLREGGLFRPRFGVESGSAKVLRLMNKRHRPAEVVPTVANLAAAGITSKVMLMTNFPGEGPEEFAQTVALARELRRVAPGTAISAMRFRLTPRANTSLAWFQRHHGPVRRRSLPGAIFAHHHAWDLPPHDEPASQRLCRVRELEAI